MMTKEDPGTRFHVLWFNLSKAYILSHLSPSSGTKEYYARENHKKASKEYSMKKKRNKLSNSDIR